MKKRSIAITLILALLMMAFSAVIVLAEDDDHGADAHSESMGVVEPDAVDEEPELVDMIIAGVITYAPYIIGFIASIIVLSIIVKIIRRSRKPKYTGRH